MPRLNWAEAWKKHFPPIAIGSALRVVPSWHDLLPRQNGTVVVLDPGLSFGTGQHPTTLFCLRQLVAHRQAGQSQSLLDIGTGSGILAISAAKLGYSPVRAVDIDPEAVRVARANAMRNQVQTRLSISHRGLTRLPLQGAKGYDLICANLTSDLLLTESDRILNRLKHEGILVLAGILAKEFLEVQRHYAKQGLRLLASAIAEEWQSASFSRPASQARSGYFGSSGQKNRKNN